MVNFLDQDTSLSRPGVFPSELMGSKNTVHPSNDPKWLGVVSVVLTCNEAKSTSMISNDFYQVHHGFISEPSPTTSP